MKIISGGLYLINLSGSINPEFGLLHYCVLLKTHDKDILLALPTTSKNKKERFISKIPEDGSYCLLKHARPISIRRIIAPLLDENNNCVIMSNRHLKILINDYLFFITKVCINSLKSNKMILDNLKKLQTKE